MKIYSILVKYHLELFNMFLFNIYKQTGQVLAHRK